MSRKRWDEGIELFDYGDSCKAADVKRVVEADRAEIASLTQALAESEKNFAECDEERDRYSNAIAETHRILGGDGEWCARIPQPPPPHSGDLAEDVVEAARIAMADIARLQQALRDATEWRPMSTAVNIREYVMARTTVDATPVYIIPAIYKESELLRLYCGWLPIPPWKEQKP